MSERQVCGCVNEEHSTGVTRCTFKCASHVKDRESQPSGEAYYKALGSVRADGSPQVDNYVREFLEGFGPLPRAEPPWRDEEGDLIQPTAAEIGCGASPYVRLIEEAGYKYVGLDPDPWVAGWMRETYNAYVYTGSYPVKDLGIRKEEFLSLIVCAHVLEHVRDAPAALDQMRRDLRRGGHLRVLVPDDTDRTNPDHFWFFSARGLKRLAITSGFTAVSVVERQIVAKEKFLYLSARRPL